MPAWKGAGRRVTSANPPSTAIIRRLVLVEVSAHGSAQCTRAGRTGGAVPTAVPHPPFFAARGPGRHPDHAPVMCLEAYIAVF